MNEKEAEKKSKLIESSATFRVNDCRQGVRTQSTQSCVL